jgi:hypothetical protein
MRGLLARVPNDVNRATAIPRGLKLPSTVEVRLDCWTPDPIVIEPKLLADGKPEGLLAMIQYPDLPGNRPGPPGGRLLVRSGGYYNVAEAPRFEPRAGVRYRMRVVRTPDRLTMFVDDRRIVTAPTPGFDAPVLHLQGSWGRTDAVVYFDNVEIRAPRVGDAGPGHRGGGPAHKTVNIQY